MHGLPAAVNIHDFVADMVLGTWLAFETADERVNARLHWISPLRTRYVFTSRLRAKAFVFTPEELAWQLGSGKAALVMEPVPLFDRAVSAALDRIARAARPAKAPRGKRRVPAGRDAPAVRVGNPRGASSRPSVSRSPAAKRRVTPRPQCRRRRRRPPSDRYAVAPRVLRAIEGGVGARDERRGVLARRARARRRR